VLESARVRERIAQLQIVFSALGTMLVDSRLQSSDARGQIALLGDLRDREIDLVLWPRCRRQRIICNHFAAIRVCINAAFSNRCKQIARRFPSLDQVIRHHGVHYVVRSALGHVAAGTVGGRGMRAGVDQTIQRRAVALAADGGVSPRRFLALKSIVRVMTRCARERAIAFSETFRLPEPVNRPGDLELVAMPRTGRVIEM